MSIFSYGPKHKWFAWHPVRTAYHGWRWLQTLDRWRTFADAPGAPVDGWWSYGPVRQLMATDKTAKPSAHTHKEQQ